MSGQGGQRRPPSLWLVLALPASLAITVFALGFGLLAALAIDGNGEAAATTTTETAPSRLAQGEQVFTTIGCSGCHALSAAGSTADIGPSLDETSLTEGEIAAVVANGREGTAMQAYSGSLSPEEIAAVAAYVSSSRASAP